MKKLVQEIVQSLSKIFSSGAGVDEIVTVLNNITFSIQKLNDKERKQLIAYLKDNEGMIARNHTLLLRSYIFFLVRDEETLKKIGRELFKYTSNLTLYHYLVWRLLTSMFQFYGDLKPQAIRWVREQCIRPSYHQMLENMQTCIQDTKQYQRKERLKKVAIVVGQLLGHLHSPSRNAFIQASGLISQYNLDVHIINTNLLPIHRELPYFGCSPFNHHPELSGRQQFSYEDAEFGLNNLTIYSYLPGHLDLHSVVNVWNYIEEEQFDAIINLGDALFATDYFKGKIPILCITTGKQLPFSLADQYLLIQTALDDDEKLLIDKMAIKEPVTNWSLNVSPEKSYETSLSREALDVPLDAFVYVVVGNRLGQEINGKFVEVCKNIIKKSQKNYVFFVGSSGSIPSLLAQFGLDSQVRCFNFQKDLRAFYSICNVYLNPFRSGGGVSAQMAILEGLPVVSLSTGDVSVCLEQEQCCQTIQDYEKLALSLCEDSFIYEHWRGLMLKNAQALQSNKPSIEKLFNILTSLYEVHSEVGDTV